MPSKLYSGNIWGEQWHGATAPVHTGWRYIKLKEAYWPTEYQPSIILFGKVEMERMGPLPFYIYPSKQFPPDAPWYEWFAVSINGTWVAVDTHRYEKITSAEYDTLGKRFQTDKKTWQNQQQKER